MAARGLRSLAMPALLAAALVACSEEKPPPAQPATGAAAPVARSLNGCRAATAVDRTGMDEVTIRFGDDVEFRYEPSCVRVSAGTRLVFVGDFMMHPFAVGRLGSSVGEPDPADPLRAVTSGDTASFVVERPGSYPFFCDVHALEGMMGAVFVE